MDVMERRDRAFQLENLAEQLDDLVREIRGVLRGTDEEDRAQRTWLANIECSLNNNHGWLGGSMVTMQDTIDALNDEDNEEDEDE